MTRELQIRELNPEDYSEAMRLHAEMNLGYELNMERPDFIARTGMFDGEKLVAACLGRVTSEGYLLLDRKWGTPEERLEVSSQVIRNAAGVVKLYGILDTNIWLPPKTNCFMKRLRKLGFVETPWPCMTARI